MYFSGGDSGDGRSSNFQAIPPSSWVGSVSFGLEGFWSNSSGKLCMVGSGSAYSSEGKLLNLAAILKLSNVKNSSTVTDLFSGTLESLDLTGDSNYFEPISILVFPQMNYDYTSISEESGTGVLERLMFRRNCTPFGGAIQYLPRIMATKGIKCSGAKQQLQLLIKFQNVGKLEYYRPFNPSTTLVGEGRWDAKRNRLCVVACRILNTTNSLANARVGDCSIRLSLRFPATWTIRNRSSMVGQIWSNRTVNDSENFSRIMFQSPQNIIEVPGLKYEYTEIDRAGKSCQEKMPVGNKGTAYPEANSFDMQFDMSVKSSTEIIAWGSSAPLFVGEIFYDPLVSFEPFSLSSSMQENSAVESHSRRIGPENISYKMSFKLKPGPESNGIINPFSSSSLGMYLQVEISAEGIYEAKTGFLCMVGCRKLRSEIQILTNDSMDCEILVILLFSPLNSRNGSYIKGSIESTRHESDPLHFPSLALSSAAFIVVEARESIWRMTMEITMVLMSNTLAFFFVSLQLFHVKKQPNLLPSISLIMLGILALGYLIPLALDFNAILLGSHSHERMTMEITMVLMSNTLAFFFVSLQLFHVKKQPNLLPSISLIMLGILALGYLIPLALDFNAILLGSHSHEMIVLGRGGWLKVNNVFVRVVTLVVFLLQCRLLLLTWSARLGHGDQKRLWAAERNGLNIPFGGTWASYAGLVVDGFLFPQILFNVFMNSGDQQVLSQSFYMGTTLIRLLPHAYDLYRAQNYAQGFDGSYIYANPGGDFYSTSWDVIIPCAGLLFSAIIFLQQRFGGGCIISKRFRESEAAYEMIPVVTGEIAM
ncbi:uncharacterized protein LOC117909071 [Vitis riparia]|uniref:uncharacterized protein LOC117909071 n=1 Tax=Vitis riparia TaxID=96939 RepID=UPI00155A5DE6|nr:uncharacterized protein LOC117909071 [Vitis riparia]